jgi:hypothetical protein
MSGRLTHSSRGTAMVETVSVLGFVLALLFGSAQIVLAGFYQLQLDAATFLYSHSYALTNNTQAGQFQNALPVVMPNAAVTTGPSAPPNTSVSDTNGIDVLGELTTGGTPTGTEQPSTNRYGGASIIRPQQIVTQASLNLTSFDISLFSNPIVLTSGNVEGQSMVANHDDDSTGYAYNGAQAANNLVSPDTSGGDDQDVPPYYSAMAYMDDCTYSNTLGYDCAASEHLNALGLAEYVKDNSNASATNGNYEITANGIGAGQLFGAMTAHQQVYAAMAALLTQTYTSYSSALVANNQFVDYVCGLSAAWDVQHASFQGNDYGTKVPQTPLASPSPACP